MHTTLRANAPGVGYRHATWIFAATTFVASALLFLVQPMFARMVLPRLGGSAAVWTTCVLFFQAVLLLAYLYAHLTVRWLGVQRQAILQLLVMAAAIPLLPLELGDAAPPPDGSPVRWLLTTLAIRLGLPFFALSTIAPLVQRWFATLSVPAAANPYALYAASNAGSVLALLAYPLLLEPLWGTRTHALVGAAGYGVLLVLAAACATCVRSGNGNLDDHAPPASTPWATKARWVAFAFVPSSLMLGVTTHMSTDLASIPLLWVLPMVVYLLTFVLAFSSRERIPRRVVSRALPVLVLGAVVSIAFQFDAPLLIPLHLAAFFAAALICHDALAHSRPSAHGLTGFYVWMAVGGLLGGVFNTLVAPALFTGIFEYPIVLVLACLVRPSPAYRRGLEPWGLFIAVAVIPVLVCSLLWAVQHTPPGVSLGAVLVIAGIVPAALSAFANRRAPFNVLAALSVAGLMVASSSRSVRGDVVFAGRSFFGVARVIEAADHSYRLLQHGTTLHGRQNLDQGSECEPQSYYADSGPVGDLFRRSGHHFTSVAIVGLGSGGLACYAEPASRWTFFEIDPLVERIATDPSLFTFLPRSTARIDIAIGDGRRLIDAAPPGSLDLIVLDAFSSDAVPTHLLTREAIGAYLSRLQPDGIVALHISNRYLDLEPVIARLAAERRLAAWINRDVGVTAADLARGRAPSHWVVLSRNAPALERLRANNGWRALAERAGVGPWTDDYSNLLRSLRWK